MTISSATHRSDLLEQIYKTSLHSAAHRLRLTVAEARAILDAMSGHPPAPGALGLRVRTVVQTAISVRGIDAVWKIDGWRLVDRLRDLPLPLSAAVEVWADDWSAHDEEEHLALVVRGK